MSTQQEERDQDNEIDNLIESISVTAGVEPDDSTTDSEEQDRRLEPKSRQKLYRGLTRKVSNRSSQR